MLKRNRILFVILFLLSLNFIYFYGGKMPYMLFYTIILMPIFSLAYTFLIFIRFKFTQSIDKRYAVKGEKAHFEFKIINEDFFFYPYVKIIFFGFDTYYSNQFESKFFSLPPLSHKSYSFEVECKYRGFYDMGIKSIELYDWLGIFRLRYNVLETKSLTIYPRILQLDKFYLKTNYNSEASHYNISIYEDMSSISHLRKYSYGDSMKKIHWKLTSKLNTLMVKNFQSTCEDDVTIIIDLVENNYEVEENTIIEDKVIEASVSILNYCLRNYIDTNLLYYTDDFIQLNLKNPNDFIEVYNTLSSIKFSSSCTVKDILEIYTLDKYEKTNIIIVTSNIDFEFYDEAHKTKLSGFDISIIYISPQEFGYISTDEKSIIDSLIEIGVKFYKINLSDDIKYVLELGT